jgi:CRP-like cAMP-binding protein
MFEALKAYFERSFPVSEENFGLIKTLLIPKSMRKGEFLVREGEVAKFGAFVVKGILRSYIIDEKGKEHIIQFAPEDWWISDTAGLTDGTPSRFFIDAIEDSEVLLIDLPAHLTLIEKLPGYAASFRTGMQKRAEAKDIRIVHSLSATAEERYNDFLDTYSSIARRVPQHMLASYLGITPETVSRIRKQASRKK